MTPRAHGPKTLLGRFPCLDTLGGILLSIALIVLGTRSATADSATASAPSASATPRGGAERPLPGQLSSVFKIDRRDPEGSIPSVKERNQNPLEFGYLLQDLLESAEQARKENDVQGVIRYYRAVAKAVPDSAKGWSKLCEAYENVQDTPRAIRACKYAVDRSGVELQDYVRYVHLILSTEGELTAADRSELAAVLTHLENQGSMDFLVNELRCEMGVKLKDIPLLETCTKALARVAPNDSKTLVFEWSLAMRKGQRGEAERLIDLARRSGVVLENIERMQEVTSSLGHVRRNMFLLAGALLLGFGALAVRARRRSLTRLPG